MKIIIISFRKKKSKIERLEEELTRVCNKYEGFYIERNRSFGCLQIKITKSSNEFSREETVDLIETVNNLHAYCYLHSENNKIEFVAY